MQRFSRLLKNINVLNIILLVAAILLADYVVLPLLNVTVKYIPAIPKKISSEKEEKTAQGLTSHPTDYTSFAYLEDKKSPRSTPGRGKRQTALKKGDTMSGYILKEIDHDKVVMVRGEDTLTVKVIDSSVKKDREAATPSAAASTSPAPGSQVRPAPATPTPRPATQP